MRIYIKPNQRSSTPGEIMDQVLQRHNLFAVVQLLVIVVFKIRGFAAFLSRVLYTVSQKKNMQLYS